MFDWQNFGVSSLKFDYRTQSKSIERLKFDWVRLPNVRLTTPGSGEESQTQKFGINWPPEIERVGWPRKTDLKLTFGTFEAMVDSGRMRQCYTEIRLSPKTSQGCNGPAVRVKGNRPRRKILLKTKTKKRDEKETYTTNWKTASQKIDCGSAPRPLRHAAKDKVKWENSIEPLRFTVSVYG